MQLWLKVTNLSGALCICLDENLNWKEDGYN